MGDGLLERFVAPGLLMAATAAFTYVFGRERAKREISSTKLGQAQDSKQIQFLDTLEKRVSELEGLIKEERAKYINAVTTLSDVRRQMQSQVDEKESVNLSLRELNNRLRNQMSKLAPIIAKAPVEDRAELWAQTGFMEMDRELRPRPAFVPMEPATITRPALRRVTDKNALPLPKPSPDELRLIDPEDYK